VAESDIEPAPTGAFGEGAPERPVGETAPSTGSRDTEQHFSRWRRGGPRDSGREGTAEHVHMIDRPRQAR
jgi:hypothetical protein